MSETDDKRANPAEDADDPASDGAIKPSDGKVGKGRPPKDKQFKPGQSGNPKGRRKGSRNLKTAFTAIMQRRVTIREDGKRRVVSGQDALLLSLFEAALRGDAKSKTQLLNLGVKFGTDNDQAQVVEDNPNEDREIFEDLIRRYSNPVKGASES